MIFSFCKSKNLLGGFIQTVLLIMVCLQIPVATNAQQLCVKPVIGGQAQLPVEHEQPYRIATMPRNIPGHTGLIVKALNRHELYEFDGEQIHLIQEPFPHVWGMAYPNGIHERPDGGAYGFGSKPKQVFYSPVETSGWRAVPKTEGYEFGFFDEGTGDAFVIFDNPQKTFRIADGLFGGAEDFPRSTYSVRTVAEIDGRFALTGSKFSYRQSGWLWFQKLGGDWQLVATDFPNSYSLMRKLDDVRIDFADGYIRIFPKSSAFAPIILGLEGETPKLINSLPPGTWHYHPASSSWMGWVGKQVQDLPSRNLFFKTKDSVEPPILHILRPGQTNVEQIPHVKPPKKIRGQKVFFSPYIHVLEDGLPAIVRTESGLALFDGRAVTTPEALRYDRVGWRPRVLSIGGRHFLQSSMGVYTLDSELKPERIDTFPIETPWLHLTEITYVQEWAAFFVFDRETGIAYRSKDMSEFEEIPSEFKIREYVGRNDDPTAVLLVGDDGLLTLTADCNAH